MFNISNKVARACVLATVLTLGLGSQISGAKAVEIPLAPAFGGGLDITLDVTVAGGDATFLIENNSIGAAAGSSVAEVYFEGNLGNFLGTVDSTAFAGSVNFIGGVGAVVNPAAPPGVSPSWGNTAANLASDTYAAWQHPGATANGIGVGDTWSVTFNLLGGVSEADLIAALITPNSFARVAMHIRECAPGKSCTLSTVPVPAAVWFMATGVVTLAGLGYRRRRKAVADIA